jgi:hypothetical protein
MWADADPDHDPSTHICTHRRTKKGVHYTKSYELTHDHAVTCDKRGWRIKKHNDIRDRVAEMSRESEQQTIVEAYLPYAPKTTPTTGKTHKYSFLRSDVRTTSVGGHQEHYDIVITHPNTSKGDGKKTLTAANRAYRRKERHYANHKTRYELDPKCNATPYPVRNPVRPIPYETYGGAHPASTAYIRHCASLFESKQPPGYNPAANAELTSRYTHAISSDLWMGNGEAIINHVSQTCTNSHYHRYRHKDTNVEPTCPHTNVPTAHPTATATATAPPAPAPQALQPHTVQNPDGQAHTTTTNPTATPPAACPQPLPPHASPSISLPPKIPTFPHPKPSAIKNQAMSLASVRIADVTNPTPTTTHSTQTHPQGTLPPQPLPPEPIPKGRTTSNLIPNPPPPPLPPEPDPPFRPHLTLQSKASPLPLPPEVDPRRRSNTRHPPEQTVPNRAALALGATLDAPLCVEIQSVDSSQRLPNRGGHRFTIPPTCACPSNATHDTAALALAAHIVNKN